MREPLRQRGLGLRQRLAVELLQGRQLGHGVLVGFKLARQALGLGSVLPVPHDERAGLLKEHGLCQCCQQLRPPREPVVTHAHHARFRNGRFGKRGQHGRRHTRGRLAGIRPPGVIDFDAVSLARQFHGKQPAHEAGAQNGKGRGWQWHRSVDRVRALAWWASMDKTGCTAMETPHASMTWIG